MPHVWPYIVHFYNIFIYMQVLLIKSLTLMVNQMLFTGIFPDSLKISKVKPLFKAGNPVLISNYRPISLLPSLSKIFERIVFQQLFDYMTDNNLFAIEQYGFRSGYFYSMCSLAVSTQDSPAVEPRSNPGSGKILMSENLRLYTTSPVVMC